MLCIIRRKKTNKLRDVKRYTEKLYAYMNVQIFEVTNSKVRDL